MCSVETCDMHIICTTGGKRVGERNAVAGPAIEDTPRADASLPGRVLGECDSPVCVGIHAYKRAVFLLSAGF